MRSLRERFESKFTPLPDAPGCWLWTAYCDPRGYGRFADAQGYSEEAYRAAYRLYVGEIPPGAHVLHTCDVPACVNPAHLRLGTHQDNMQQRNERGRTAHGMSNGRSKLTTAEVARIRREIPVNVADVFRLAREIGVSPANVAVVACGVGRKHG